MPLIGLLLLHEKRLVLLINPLQDGCEILALFVRRHTLHFLLFKLWIKAEQALCEKIALFLALDGKDCVPHIRKRRNFINQIHRIISFVSLYPFQYNAHCAVIRKNIYAEISLIPVADTFTNPASPCVEAPLFYMEIIEKMLQLIVLLRSLPF